MKNFLLVMLVLLSADICLGQGGEISHRVILIGDAGEVNVEQIAALTEAADRVIPGKTVVLFLGDNVYPKGVGLPGDRKEAATKQVLKSQFWPMRAKGAPVYFIPGNHDWSSKGLGTGFEKIKQAGKFLVEQKDAGLQQVPANGCPGPVAIPIGETAVIIAYDSQWWLYRKHQAADYADCACKSKEEVLTRMRELKAENEGKFILLASHHPFQSYGPHGGKFRAKDIFFPLTNAVSWLYLPAPALGLLYVWLRPKLLRQDIKNKVNQDMIKRIESVFDSTSRTIYVAGHEHGLQFIRTKHLQIVSGAGAKKTYTRTSDPASLFSEIRQGFVIVDVKPDRSLQISFYVIEAHLGLEKERWILGFDGSLKKAPVTDY